MGLSSICRRKTTVSVSKKSFNSRLALVQVTEIPDVMGGGSRRPSCESLGDHQQHLHPANYPNPHRRSPSLRYDSHPPSNYYFNPDGLRRRGNSPSYQRSPSPRRRYPPHLHHDIGFSDTVSNVVEIVKHEHHRSHHKRFVRGEYHPITPTIPPKTQILENLIKACFKNSCRPPAPQR